MMLINTDTMQRVDEYYFRSLYPNISFANTLSNASLEGYGHMVLNYPEQPQVPSTQKVLDNGANEFIDGEWFVKWEIVDKTPQELYAENPRPGEIQYRLQEINNETIVPLRAVVVGTGTDEQKQLLAALDTEYHALSEELAALQPAA